MDLIDRLFEDDLRTRMKLSPEQLTTKTKEEIRDSQYNFTPDKPSRITNLVSRLKNGNC
jgi:hypothetical protein